MVMKRILVPVLVAVSLKTQGVETPSAVSFEENGSLKIGDICINFTAATASWSFLKNDNFKNIEHKKGMDFRAITAQFEFSGVQAQVTEKLRQTGRNTYRVESDFVFSSPVFSNSIFAGIEVPIPAGKLEIDGETVKIPESTGEAVLVSSRQAGSLRVESVGGLSFTISGKLRVMVQDNRKWGRNNISIRLLYSPGNGQVSRAGIDFILEVFPLVALPVDLGSAANRGFSDPDSSGWIGKGNNQDLSSLSSGNLTIAGFPFLIARGKGAIVIGRGVSATGIRLDLPAGNQATAINLLHAADWSQMAGWQPENGKPIGFLDIVYDNGRKQSIPVKTNIDCGHWLDATASYSNAAEAFTAAGNASSVRLFASSFSLSHKNPLSIEFKSAMPEASTWMIAGVTLSNSVIRFPPRQDNAFVIKEGEQWRKLDFPRRIVKGSPLDFSTLSNLDAPAGKYGFVCATPDGEFTFGNAPDKRIRFYGVNLCFTANFMEKEVVDETVEYLARMGYNSVRLHHQDNGMIDKNATDSLTFDSVAMDKLDYLFAKLKERGIYITTDLYVNRKFKPGDNINVKDPDTLHNVKGLLPINHEAMENWKEFARRWMNHRNPYTGLTWGEDPALAKLCMVNEQSLVLSWGRSPELIPLYREAFEEWKRKNRLSRNDHTSFESFLGELEVNMCREQMRFVRDELKVKAMLTGTTGRYTMAEDVDFTDEHAYFSHPVFIKKAWRVPIRFDASSPIRNNVPLPRLLMPRRFIGKPLTVTEFNFCPPNRFCAESGPLVGAYAALQNWGGLWRFCWSHSEWRIKNLDPVMSFDAVNDPTQQFSDRIIIALFLRGDMSPAREQIVFQLPRDYKNRSIDFPMEFLDIGLNAQIGWSYAGEPLPEGARLFKPGIKPVPDSRLKLDSKAGTFAVITERSETITLPGGALDGGTLRVKKADRFMTVAAISRDNRPLAESGDILIIHLTNISNSNAAYDNENTIRSWGKLPLLIERGTAELELAGKSPWRVMALATDGSGYGEVQGEFSNGIFRFKLDTGGFPGGVMAYHLTR